MKTAYTSISSIVVGTQEAEMERLTTGFLSFLVGDEKRIIFLIREEPSVSLVKGKYGLEIERNGKRNKVTDIKIDNSNVKTEIKRGDLAGLSLMLLVRGGKIISFQTKEWRLQFVLKYLETKCLQIHQNFNKRHLLKCHLN